MSKAFDLDNYFANKDAANTGGVLSSDTYNLNSKQQRVAEASASKQAALQSISDRVEANKSSWAGQLDLDPDEGLGVLVNKSAAGFQSIGSVIGDAAESAADGYAGLHEDAISDAHRLAHYKEQHGRDTAADTELLDSAPQGIMTPRQRIETAAKAKADAKAFSNVVSLDDAVAKRVDGTAPNSLGRDMTDLAIPLAKGAVAVPEIGVGLVDMVSGGHAGKALEEAGFKPKEAKEFLDSLYTAQQQMKNRSVQEQEGFLNTLSAMADNPSVIANTVLESIFPMLAGGVVSKGLKALGMGAGGAAAAGEGAVMAGSAAEGIRQESKDGLLSGKQTAASVGTGLMGALVGRLGGSAANRAGVGDIDTLLADSAVRGAARNTPYRVAVGGAIEGGEELLQSSGETILKNIALDKQWDEGLGNAAAMGLVTGTAMGAPSNVIRPEAEGVEKAAIMARESAKLARAASNPKASSNPVASLGRIGEIKETIASQIAEVEKAIADTVPEDLKAAEARLPALRELLEKTPEDQAEKRAELTDGIAKMEAIVIAMKAQHEKATKPQRTEIEVLKRSLSQVESARESVEQAANAAPVEDIAAKIDTIKVATQEVDATDPEAVKAVSEASTKAVILAMESPELLDVEQAEAIAANPSNGLSDQQRSFLRTFSKAKAASHAAKGLEGVSKDIFEGNQKDGYKGINEYTQIVGKALTQKNPDFKRASKAIEGLGRFAASRKAKFATASAAYDRVEGTGNAEQWVPEKSGNQVNWVKATRPYTHAELNKVGGMEIHGGSSEYVSNIGVETDAVVGALESLQAMTALTQSGGTAKQSEPLKEEVAPNQGKGAAAVKAEAPEAVEQEQAEPAPSPIQPGAEAATDQESTAAQEKEESLGSEKEQLPVVDDQNYQAEEGLETVETPDVQAEAEPETGALSVFARAVKVAQDSLVQSFDRVNWVAQWVKQSAKTREASGISEADAGLPLVAKYNFVSKVRQDPSLILQYLPEGLLASTETVQAAVEQFASLVSDWGKTIQADLRTMTETDTKYFYKDPFYFLVDQSTGEPQIDENLKSAMVLASVQWLSDQTANGTLLTNGGVNLLLGRDEDAPVGREEGAYLRQFTTIGSTAVNSLGRSVIQALGLKAADSSVPGNVMPALEAAIGTRVLALLINRGLVARHVLTGQELQDMHGVRGLKKEELESPFTFIALAKTPAAEPDGYPSFTPGVEAVADLNRGTGNLLGKLFGVTEKAHEPKLKPFDFKQENPSNTTQESPQELVEILDRDVKKAYKVNAPMERLISNISDAALERMAGISAPETLVPKALRPGLKAAEDAIRRDITNAKNFFGLLYEHTEDQLGQLLYMPRSIWKHHRVGMEGDTLNPQASKVHRAMVSMEAWQAEIDVANPAHAPMIEQLKLAVMEALGEKTDKVPNETTLKKFDLWLAEEKTQKVLAVIQKTQEGQELTEQEESDLIDAVSVGGEKLFSLNGLVAAAAYQNALNGGDTTFTTSFYREVDGKTNGAMLANLQMAAFDSVESAFDFMQRGGFFQEGSPYETYSQYRGDPGEGNKDLYESTADLLRRVIPKAAGELLFKFTGDIINEVDEITSAGRNLVKNPDTAVVYGSGIKTAVGNMAHNFVDKAYDRLQKIANGKGRGDTLEALVADLNQILVPAKVGIPANISLETFLETPLTRKQEAVLVNWYTHQFGKGIEKTMLFQFGDFMKSRDLVNGASQVAYEMFNVVYQTERKKKIAELVKAKQLPVNGKGDPIMDLSVEQEQEIFDAALAMAPITHSPFTSGTELKQGVSPVKTKMATSNEPGYSGEAKFKNGVRSVGARVAAAKTMNFNAQKRENEDPGVALLVLLTQSTDSAISARAYDKLAALNVHDAHILGLKDVLNGGKNLNQATFEVMRDFSIAAEVDAMLERSLNAFSEYLAAGTLTSKDLAPVFKRIDGIIRRTFDPKVMNKDSAAKLQAAARKRPASFIANTFRQFRLKADNLRLEVVGQIASVDQYSLEGGSFFPSKDDKDKAAEAREALQSIPTRMELKEVDRLNALLAEAGKVDAKKETEPTETPHTPWGVLGKSKIKHDAGLVAFFKANPKPTRNQLIKSLDQAIKALPNARTREYYGMLLKGLNRTTSRDLQVVYVTRSTPLPENLESEKVQSGRGFFVFDQTSDTIYVKSPDFVSSGITAELLIHELTHAAVARTIDMGEKGLLSADLQAHVDGLKGLLAQAKASAEKAGLSDTYDNALANVQEFVAWGMTNPEFQREVLAPLKVKGKSLVDGMKAFVDHLVGLLFRNSPKSEAERQATALTHLITHVSALMGPGVSGGITSATQPTVLAMTYVDVELDSTQIFEGLANPNEPLSPSFSAHLTDLLDQVVRPLHGAYGAIRSAALKDQSLDIRDRFVKALAEGAAPLAKSVRGQLKMSDQEAFMAEQIAASVRAALESKDRSTSLVYKELVRIHEEVSGALTAESFHQGDWATATDAEKALAEDKRSHFLDLEQGTDKSDYLSRFAALAITNSEFYKLLDRPTARDTRDLKALGWVDRIQALVERLMAYMAGKITKTWAGQQANEKVHTLVKELVEIEAKYRDKVSQPRNKWLELSEEVLDGAIAKGRGKALDLIKSPVVSASKVNAVRALGAVTTAVGEDRVDQVMDAGKRLRDQIFQGREGVIASLATEIRGFSEQMLSLIRAAKKNEQTRKQLITWTGKHLVESFENKGKHLTSEMKQSLSILLRADLATLIDSGMTLQELRDALVDPKRVQSQIDELAKQLEGVSTHSAMYLRRANALGKFMATNVATIDNLMLNAGNIARMFGTPAANTVPEATVAQTTPLIDQLASLYALQYSSETDKQMVANLMDQEARRADQGNGIDFTIKLHKALQQQAKERLFEGSEALMMKGYLPEIYNPYTEVVAATEAEGAQLVREGWEKVSEEMAQDAEDPRGEGRSLYVLRNRGMVSRVSGALSSTGERARGSDVRSDLKGNMAVNSAAVVGRMAKVKMAREMRSLNQVSKSGTHMVPTLNAKGEIVNYRYMMSSKVRDNLLERNNSFDMLLGTLQGNTFDKEATRVQNWNVFASLHKQWEKDRASNPNAYVMVGPDSSDKEAREAWALLAKDSQEDIRAIWGNRNMWVRSDQLDLVTGYRKYSLAEIFEKDPRTPANERNPGLSYENEQSIMEGAFAWLVRDVFGLGEKAALRVRQAEDIWQAVVSEVKDIVVIRSGLTLYWNVVSNMTLLAIEGVPIKDILRNHWVAWRGAKEYQENSEELHRLESELSSGTAGDVRKVQQRIRQLQDALARNPAKELIDAGMLPTIAEDVDVGDDPYSYKSQAAKLVQKHTSWVPESVATAAKHVYIAPGTSWHTMMSRATQYSDFVGRYTLYQHVTNRKKSPMTKDEAMKHISDSFVNYDLPSGKAMQYMNDTGLLMFTKYYLRIQRPIFNLLKNHPIRALSMAMMADYFGGIQTIMDSSMVGRLGNPFEWGALQYPFALDELGTFKLAEGLIR